MIHLPAPSLEPIDTLFLQAVQDRPTGRPNEGKEQAGRFDAVLERVSARKEYQSRPEDHVEAKPIKAEARKAPAQETDRVETDRKPAAGARQSQAGAVARPAVQGRDRAREGERAEQAKTDNRPTEPDTQCRVEKSATDSPASGTRDSKEQVTVTLVGTASEENASLSIEGLSEQFLDYFLNACTQPQETGQTIAPAQESNTTTEEESAAVSSGGQVKLTVKLTADPKDAAAVVDEVLALINSFIQAMPKDLAGKLKIHVVQARHEGPVTPGGLSELLAKAIPEAVPLVQDKASLVFKDVLRGTNATDTPVAPEAVMDLTPDVVAPEDVSLPAELLAKVRVAMTVAAPAEPARTAREPNAEAPSNDGGYKPFADSGNRMQQVIQRQAQPGHAGKAEAFSSIMAERLADVAEQTALRDKPMDIMLRLKMENGDSLFVSLKDQAGKVLVNLRCADQQMYNLLQSQKDTITRHLEQKQVSTSISVTPIEEDMTRRQGRDQKRDTWGGQRNPFNPYVEIQV